MGDDADLFTGLDEIDWAGMHHAYGRAVEVPGLLRRLIDPDPAVRECALDYMYGVVHHQGNVYPCTIATIPFLLRIAERPDAPRSFGSWPALAPPWMPPNRRDPTGRRTRRSRPRGLCGNGCLRTTTRR